MKETIDHICAGLRECNRAAVKRVVTAIGAEQSLALLTQALAIEANGGMLTHDGQRRRTPGGVFFQLARAVVPKEQHLQVFPSTYVLRKEKRRREGAKRQTEGTETDAVVKQARPDISALGPGVSVTTGERAPHQPPTAKAVKAPTTPVRRARCAAHDLGRSQDAHGTGTQDARGSENGQTYPDR